MPYQTIEQINERGYEKISMFLTVQHFLGIAACVLPGLALIDAIGSMVLRAIILLLLAALGYLLTTELDGMAPYQRLLWRLRGASRALLRGRVVSPEDLPGTAARPHVAIDWAGARVRRRPPDAASPATAAAPRGQALQGADSHAARVH